MKIVLFLIFFLFDFAWMGARFDWLLNSEDAQFRTMKTPKKGEYIWIGPKFERSSWSQRHQLGCNFSLSELQEAPDDACKVWWVSFSADISSSKRVFITNVKGTFFGMSESEEASKRR